MLADNKLTENGAWDNDLLQAEIGALKDLNFDISLTGFSLGVEPAYERILRYNAIPTVRIKVC